MAPEPIEARLAAAGLPPLPRRVWLEIDESALASNLGVFRELVGPRVQLSAVVKADAYGHGLIPVARVAQRAGVDRLCVASIDEALLLRRAGVETDILVLFAVPPERVAEAFEADIQLSVTDPGSLAALQDFTADEVVAAEVEVETGLSRGGFKPDALPVAVREVRASPSTLGPTALWTHMASPDDESVTARQVAEFDRAAQLALADGEISGSWRHAASTGGLLTGRVPHYEGVRVGLGLYGIVPADLPVAPELQPFADRLRPAMALKCRPLRVETFPAGTAVGYGGRWVAQRESVIATLPVGYGDGWARSSSPAAQALVRGSRVPLVGVVAMDALMADVTDVPGLGADDEFVLIGRQGDDEISANEVARARNTIAWEVVTGMAYRVPRVYHAGSVLLGVRTLDGESRGAFEAMA